MSRLQILFTALAVAAPLACGSPVYWTVWNITSSPSVANGIDFGTITIGAQTVDVTYTGEISFDQAGGTGQTNWFIPASSYSGGVVDNAPFDGGMIGINGLSAPHIFTFSSPLVNPVFSVMSLGRSGLNVSYNFDATPTLIIGGTNGIFGGGAIGVSGNSVTGHESNGTVEFLGTYSSLSFTVSGSEFFNGFTVGAMAVAPSTVPEPGTYSTALLGTVLVALAFMGRRPRRRRSRF